MLDPFGDAKSFGCKKTREDNHHEPSECLAIPVDLESEVTIREIPSSLPGTFE